MCFHTARTRGAEVEVRLLDEGGVREDAVVEAVGPAGRHDLVQDLAGVGVRAGDLEDVLEDLLGDVARVEPLGRVIHGRGQRREHRARHSPVDHVERLAVGDLERLAGVGVGVVVGERRLEVDGVAAERDRRVVARDAAAAHARLDGELQRAAAALAGVLLLRRRRAGVGVGGLVGGGGGGGGHVVAWMLRLACDETSLLRVLCHSSA